jgi:hypothetical protein
LGDLTDVGKEVGIYELMGTLDALLNDPQSTYNFGVALRQLYVDK